MAGLPQMVFHWVPFQYLGAQITHLDDFNSCFLWNKSTAVNFAQPGRGGSDGSPNQVIKQEVTGRLA